MGVNHTCMCIITAFYTVLSTLYCDNVTRAKLNGSAVDFDSFRERFHRTYDANSQQFDSRRLFFQVGDKSQGENTTIKSGHKRHRLPSGLPLETRRRPLMY